MHSCSSIGTRHKYDFYEAGSHSDNSEPDLPKSPEQNNGVQQDQNLNKLKIKNDGIFNVQFTIEIDHEETEAILSRMEVVLGEGTPIEQGAIFYSLVTSYNQLQIEVAQQIKFQIQENLIRKNSLMNQLFDKISHFNGCNYFMQADLQEKKMHCFDISNFEMNLIEANFNGCDLSSAYLSNAEMGRARFNGAILNDTYFQSSTLPTSILNNDSFKQSRSVVNEEIIQFVNEEGIFSHPCFERDDNSSEQVNKIQGKQDQGTKKCIRCTIF